MTDVPTTEQVQIEFAALNTLLGHLAELRSNATLLTDRVKQFDIALDVLEPEFTGAVSPDAVVTDVKKAMAARLTSIRTTMTDTSKRIATAKQNAAKRGVSAVDKDTYLAEATRLEEELKVYRVRFDALTREELSFRKSFSSWRVAERVLELDLNELLLSKIKAYNVDRRVTQVLSTLSVRLEEIRAAMPTTA